MEKLGIEKPNKGVPSAFKGHSGLNALGAMQASREVFRSKNHDRSGSIKYIVRPDES